MIGRLSYVFYMSAICIVSKQFLRLWPKLPFPTRLVSPWHLFKVSMKFRLWIILKKFSKPCTNVDSSIMAVMLKIFLGQNHN